MNRTKLLKDAGFEIEEKEDNRGKWRKTDFPKPFKSYTLNWEVYDLSIEEPYFWILDFIKGSFTNIKKLEDSFAASENSAFFGLNQQRLGAQQDRITQIIVGVGKLVKELFQIVREIRIIKERLTYYEESSRESEKNIGGRSKSAEVTLKGIFVDLVQGGGKSPASIYGMARELEFVTLPDLFFDAPPFKNTKELDKHIENLGKDFNKSVLRVLQRHLKQFLEWKARTYSEHKTRERFQLKYLQQHYEVINMYLSWLKPYLRNVNKLSLKEKNMDSADMITAFEGSMLDVEFLAYDVTEKLKVKGKEFEKGYDCVLVTFNYRTRPEMKVVQEGYNRGPVHIGKMEMNLRAYRWIGKDIKNYEKLKDQENMELMGMISSSLQAAMESLGKELIFYLNEAKGIINKDKNMKDEKQDNTKKEKNDSKTLIQKLFGDFLPHPKSKVDKGSEYSPALEKKKKEVIKKFKKSKPNKALGVAFNTYKYFKKSHRMITE